MLSHSIGGQVLLIVHAGDDCCAVVAKAATS
jgi:hypothetical protein